MAGTRTLCQLEASTALSTDAWPPSLMMSRAKDRVSSRPGNLKMLVRRHRRRAVRGSEPSGFLLYDVSLGIKNIGQLCLVFVIQEAGIQPLAEYKKCL